MEKEAVRSDIDELNAVRSQIKAWRTTLMVLAVGIVFVCTLLMWNSVSSLASEGARRDLFVQKLGEVVQNDILPQVQDVGVEAVRSIDFNGEIDKLNKRAPEVANKSMEELRKLATNVPASGKDALSKEFESVLEGRLATLQREFPDADEEQLKWFLGEFSAQTQTELTVVTDSLFNPHIESMNNIIADVEAIKKAEGTAAKGQVPTWEMAFLIVDIARSDVEGMQEEISAVTTGEEKAQ